MGGARRPATGRRTTSHDRASQYVGLVVSRNYGLTANEKVNELVEGLAVAVVIVVALLSFGLGPAER